jgi:hypothetical protein
MNEKFEIWENNVEQVITINGILVKSLEKIGITRRIKHILIRHVITTRNPSFFYQEFQSKNPPIVFLPPCPT